MPVDRRKGLQAAERLLKQGKLQAALAELQRVSESAPDDLLTLNRLGDLLARQGRNDEAIDYYRKIAVQFADGGFLPKSAAIHKKILRIDPHNLESLVSLGELYLSQNLHGEARNYLLHAASQHVEAQSFEQARSVYEKLVEAEPDELRHRIRLAETRAAEGDEARAGSEMLSLARSLLEKGSPSEAEKVFLRAADLVPASLEPLLGACECLVADSREDEALARLESRISGDAPPQLVGELAWHYDRAGRCDEALELIRGTDVLEVSHRTWIKLFTAYAERDEVDELWAGLDPLFEACEQRDAARLAELFSRLDEVEERGHLPALERLYALQQRRGETAAVAASLESLVSAYRARSMSKEAARMAERLRELAPELDADGPATQAPPAAEPEAAQPRIADPPGRPSEDVPLEAEAPAVPLNRGDEEFVAGRLTQAEVLEKYGLTPQALEQIESVTARFPGHVKAQEARVELLRVGRDASLLAEALAQLALARRAAGDNEAALCAAAEASAGQLREASRTVLQQCRLIDGGATGDPDPTVVAESPSVAVVVDSDPETGPAGFESVASTDETPGDAADLGETPAGAIGLADGPAVPIEQTAVGGGVAATEQSPAVTEAAHEASPAVSQSDVTVAPGDDADIIIDFDAQVADTPAPEPAPSSAPVDAAPTPTTRVPGADMLEEIEGFVAAEAWDEARRRITALRTLGYAGEALDALAQRIESGGDLPDEAREEPQTESAEPVPEPPDPDDGDEGLGAIAAALDEELGAIDGTDQPIVPEEDPEQSMDEIFSSFKAAVQEQVSEEDHGTHYDLAIAYKEMGLVEEAIREFEIASTAPDFHRQACTMIGLCQSEQGAFAEAAEWYRKALEAAAQETGEDAVVSHLRYDLGEVLLAAGDHEQALMLFQEVLQFDSSYRDVRARVAQLEDQLQP